MMKRVMEPEEHLFVAVKNNHTTDISTEIIQTLQQRVRSVQTWFLDLDDNHAPSPAKKIAKRAIGTSHFSPRYLQWCGSTAFKLVRSGKSVESEAWKEYVDRFLRNEDALAEVQRLFTPEYSRQSLYPGVEEFCGLVSDAQRFYVTRNIAEVASAYASILNFDGFFPESYNKEKVVEKYLKRNPHVQKYGVEGDSEEDGVMVDVLQFYGKEVIAFYSTETIQEESFDPWFNYVIEKDRTFLVDLLKR